MLALLARIPFLAKFFQPVLPTLPDDALEEVSPDDHHVEEVPTAQEVIMRGGQPSFPQVASSILQEIWTITLECHAPWSPTDTHRIPPDDHALIDRRLSAACSRVEPLIEHLLEMVLADQVGRSVLWGVDRSHLWRWARRRAEAGEFVDGTINGVAVSWAADLYEFACSTQPLPVSMQLREPTEA